MQKILLLALFVFANAVQAATLTVTNSNDDGSTGELRAVIAAATPGDTITFAANLSGETITLSSPLIITGNLTINGDIDGDGTPDVIVSGGGTTRIFYINNTLTNSAVTLNGLRLQNGKATGSDQGGAIYNFAGTLTLSNSTLSGNSASNVGGAIYNQDTLSVTNSTLSGNSAAGGGAIYNEGTLSLTSSSLSGNSASGGGVIENYGMLSVTNSTLSSSSGGAIVNFSGGTVNVTNSTLSGNSAARDGGAIYNDGTLTVTNSTLSGNLAGSGGRGRGGAISNAGTLTLTNSLIWNNAAPSAPSIFGSITRSYSLIQGFDATTGTGNLDGLTNAGNANYPLFTTPLDPSTAPSTAGNFTLQSSSPAINKGDSNKLLESSVALDLNGDGDQSDNLGQGNDLAGNPRIQGTKVDLGAYETAIAFGDLNGDSSLDQADLTIFITYYGLTSNSPSWNAAADLNNDNRINMYDYRLLRRALAGL